MSGSNTVLKTLLIIVSFALTGCTTIVRKDWSLEPLPTEKELDEKVILKLSDTQINTGVQGYNGISGRMLELLLVAYAEMIENHADRCESEPLTRHLFFYNEHDEKIEVGIMPRSIPDRWLPPNDPDLFDERYVFDFIPNSRGLDGCEILFVIDKKTKRVISTQIIR